SDHWTSHIAVTSVALSVIRTRPISTTTPEPRSSLSHEPTPDVSVWNAFTFKTPSFTFAASNATSPLCVQNAAPYGPAGRCGFHRNPLRTSAWRASVVTSGEPGAATKVVWPTRRYSTVMDTDVGVFVEPPEKNTN